MESRPRRAAAALAEFYETPLEKALARHRAVDPEVSVLDFFRGVVRDVPAYRRFLERHGVDATRIQSLADFARLPATTKDDYQRAFPLPELCRGGSLDAVDFFALSSGSTGEPAPWPRFVSDELGTAFRFEQVLSTFGAREKSTLGVVCFPLGSWVGGMYTTFACRHVAAKGYRLTLVTPGNNKAEILRAVRALAPCFEQLVLFGYPPFLKEVIDAGLNDGLDWSRHQPAFAGAGEVFSEEWRALVATRLGIRNPAVRSASLYGTADGGVLANETPLSVSIRGILARHPERARSVFGEARLPTLCQYDPAHRYFECENGELLFSGDGGIPLVRYKILDRGGILTYRKLLDEVALTGEDPFHSVPHADPAAANELPFVYVFGRTNFALSFYGANVYPENVSVGLETPELARSLTGKFVMQIVHGADRDPALHVTLELAAGAAPSSELGDRAASSIRAALLRLNSEFAAYTPEERQTPSIELRPLGDPAYFPVGIKHRYTRA